jgi:ATP-dependent exoDNAse (exonuclease V) alpha subunit
MRLDSTQIAAVEHACSSRFSIITGGAGTGKTSLIREITTRLESRGEKVALAAFAGKAAARIREACEHPASTVHRLLQYNGRAYLNPTLADVSLIIDESSMLDSLLLAEVMKRNPRRLCLVGDAAQLAPVGRGMPFHNLLELRPDLVATLTKCYRATEAVYQAASAIRSGSRPPLSLTSDGERWSMQNTGNPEQTQREIMKWVEAGFFDFDTDIIITARNGENDEDPCTVRGLNKAIVDAISPRKEKQKFNVGDRVVNTHNIFELDFYNGNTGKITAIDIDGGIWIKTDFPIIDRNKTKDESDPVYTSHVLFSKENRKYLELAYVITCHRAQGSQYKNVCFAAFNRDSWGLLDRSLLYTAVTRTKEACVVVGELSAVYAAVGKKNVKRTVLQVIGEQP